VSRAKKHKVKYPLAAKLTSGPQTPVALAVERAETLVETLQEDLQGAVDSEIANVQSEADRAGPGRLKDLYESADRLMALAGACKLRGVSEAALGLCDLLEQLRASGRWDAAGVAVHVESLRLLRHEASPQAAAVVLNGLSKVRAKLAS
jgi:hypothetical protein